MRVDREGQEYEEVEKRKNGKRTRIRGDWKKQIEQKMKKGTDYLPLDAGQTRMSILLG